MGVEFFQQDGRYGVMCDGRVTCPAKFRRVERLQEDSGFFALATYVTRDKHDLDRLVEVTTVIDRQGRDLQVRLFGDVRWCNGYFYGEVDGVGFFQGNSWDPVGNSYYDTDPCFREVAGVEVGLSTEHGGRTPCMKLRSSTGRVSPRFNVCEMFYNRDIIIARDYLIVKRDKNHSYRIRGYMDGCILVESDERYGFQQITPKGRKGEFYSRLPKESKRVADYRKLGLQRVQA